MLEQIFESVEALVLDANAGDFNSSDASLVDIDQEYSVFKSLLSRSSLSMAQYNALTTNMDLARGGLDDFLDFSRQYNESYRVFQDFLNQGDTYNATLLAPDLTLLYDNFSLYSGQVNDNFSLVLNQTNNTHIDTGSLEHSLVKLDEYVNMVTAENQVPLSLIVPSDFNITADRTVAAAGDTMMLTATGPPAAGKNVTFYADGVPVATAIADDWGNCTVPYQVIESSISRAMLFYAQYESTLSPAIAVSRQSMATVLTVEAYPGTASYGDTIVVNGSFATAAGKVLSGIPVQVRAGDYLAGSATTGADGRFSYSFAVNESVPGGDCPVYATYQSSLWPDYALTDSTSEAALVSVTPRDTVLQLAQLPGTVRGGQKVQFVGSLMTADGQPVANAVVGAYVNKSLLATMKTDAQGRFKGSPLISFNDTPGQYQLYAAFRPKDGRALGGSTSARYPVTFAPVTPVITVIGMPLFVFPGDNNITVSGSVRASTLAPVGSRRVLFNVSGVTVNNNNTTTDATGSYRFNSIINGSPGLYILTVKYQGYGMITDAEQPAGIIIVAPFDALTDIVLLLAAIVVATAFLAARMFAGDPRIRKLLRPSRVPVPIAPPPEPAEYQPEALDRAAEVLRAIEASIAAGGDGRSIITRIYEFSRSLTGAGEEVPGSFTHREFSGRVGARYPAIAAPVRAITGSYETAIFGNIRPDEAELVRSLRSLEAISSYLAGGERE